MIGNNLRLHNRKTEHKEILITERVVLEKLEIGHNVRVGLRPALMSGLTHENVFCGKKSSMRTKVLPQGMKVE